MPSLRTLPTDLRLFAKYHLIRRVVDHPARETELGVVEIPFDIDDYAASLERFSSAFDIGVEASVEYQGREHPITVATSKRGGGRCLLVLAGVHGNERAGLIAVPEAMDAYAAADSDVRLVIVTPVNPVGAQELSRYNAHGYDINRDFVRFDTAEARLVRELVDRERPDMIVSLHEGPQDATFMFTNEHVSETDIAAILGALEAGGTELATHDYFGRRLATPGVAPSSRALRAINAVWARTLKMMTTGTYAERRGIPEITLESSWRQPDARARVQPHVDLIAAALDRLTL